MDCVLCPDGYLEPLRRIQLCRSHMGKVQAVRRHGTNDRVYIAAGISIIEIRGYRRAQVMLYAIVCTDAPDSLGKRLPARSAHMARLANLQDQGRLLLAGPFPNIDSSDPGLAGFSGSLIVAEFDSLETAHAWANADPYVNAGVFMNVSVKPFKKVLPA